MIGDLSKSKLVYLASPYSHDDDAMMLWRFERAAEAAAYLMRQGLLVFSPIAHTHPIAQFGLPKGWDFWKQYDSAFMDVCLGGIVVLALPGWVASKGVQAEIAYMRDKDRPIEFLYPDDMNMEAAQ